MLVYFTLGKLPWQGLKAKTAQLRQQIILEKKLATPLEQLCAGCPCAFRDYIQYCRQLQFDEKPDLEHMKGIFRSLYHSLGYAQLPVEWDWDRFRGGAPPVVTGAPAPAVATAPKAAHAVPQRL